MQLNPLAIYLLFDEKLFGHEFDYRREIVIGSSFA
jgi:hypothetical protein